MPCVEMPMDPFQAFINLSFWCLICGFITCIGASSLIPAIPFVIVIVLFTILTRRLMGE